MLVTALCRPIGALRVRAVEQNTPGEGRSAVVAASATAKPAPKVEGIAKQEPEQVALKVPALRTPQPRARPMRRPTNWPA